MRPSSSSLLELFFLRSRGSFSWALTRHPNDVNLSVPCKHDGKSCLDLSPFVLLRNRKQLKSAENWPSVILNYWHSDCVIQKASHQEYATRVCGGESLLRVKPRSLNLDSSQFSFAARFSPTFFCFYCAAFLRYDCHCSRKGEPTPLGVWVSAISHPVPTRLLI